MRIRRFLAAAAAALSVIAGLPQNVSAGPALMPGGTEEMTDASFWVNGEDGVLADTASLKTLNQAIIGTKECRMTDLSSASETFDGEALKRSLVQGCMKEISDFLNGSYYKEDGKVLSYEDLKDVPGNIDGCEASKTQAVQYGILIFTKNTMGRMGLLQALQAQVKVRLCRLIFFLLRLISVQMTLLFS